MRSFDYIKTPEQLLKPEIVQMVGSIHEHKGKQELFLEANIDELKTLLEVALIQSTGASNRIEGIYTTDKRLEELVRQKAEPRNRSEQEISGYRTKEDKKRDAEMEVATLTMPEMARQLGITRNQVYGILNSQKYQHFFEFVTIADRKKITKESFQKFLEGQDEYHLDPANDYEELAMEENVALANYRRKKLVQTGERGRNGNLQYLTIDEAAFMAKVSWSMINVWYTKGYFPVVKIRNHVRIKRKEFEAWLEKRNTERGC